jgi:hypothetical protein
MAIHHSSIVCDLTFELLEDAKRVFIEKFSYRAWLPNAQPRWSRFEDNLDDVLAALPEGAFDDVNPIRELHDGFHNMNRFNSGVDIIEVFQPESQLTH